MVDTGCNNNISAERDVFDMYSTNSNNQMHTAMSEDIQTTRFIPIQFKCNNTNDDDSIIQDVLRLPILSLSLRLVSKHNKNCFSITFGNEKKIIRGYNRFTVVTGKLMRKYY